MKTDELNTRFKLIIKRNADLRGSVLKTNILISNAEQSKVGYNGSVEFNLPRKYTNVKLYTRVPLGRNIVKEFVIDPVLNGTVEVCVSYKMNLLALIPPFTFLIPTSIIKTDIRYY